MRLDEVIVPIAIFGTFGYGLRTYLDYKTRRLLIEKGLIDEKVKFLYHQSADAQVPGALKWGMVLVALGLAIFLAQSMPDNQEEYAFALMSLFGGIALLGYHVLALRWIKKQSL